MVIKDLIGVGIGPYHLGMAALIEESDAFDAIFFEQQPSFDWHPGMLIDGTDLQVPFLADLVTYANPKSHFTFLNYLHSQNRLYQFFSFNEFNMPRKEYNHYAQWVAQQLNNCHFGHRVTDVFDRTNEQLPHYEVVVHNQETNTIEHFYAKHISIGTGSKPLPPPFIVKDNPLITHTSSYTFEKEEIKSYQNITVIGSGQSAAEVFLDLLESQPYHDYHLTWYTRSQGILQLESSKLGQEFFTPDFVDFFHPLSFKERQNTLDTLDFVRNGVDPDTLNTIYKWLYHRSIGNEKLPVTIQANAELNDVKPLDYSLQLSLSHQLSKKEFKTTTERLIMATGYTPNIPSWIYKRFSDKIKWENKDYFKMSRNYHLLFQDERNCHIFMLTGIEHSHGAEATNLGMAVNRNIHIINTIAQKEVYKEQRHVIFQSFDHNDD